MELVTGRWYHVSGWRRGNTFRLIKYDKNFAYLESPKKRKKYIIPVERLQQTNRHSNKEDNGKNSTAEQGKT